MTTPLGWDWGALNVHGPFLWPGSNTNRRPLQIQIQYQYNTIQCVGNKWRQIKMQMQPASTKCDKKTFSIKTLAPKQKNRLFCNTLYVGVALMCTPYFFCSGLIKVCFGSFRPFAHVKPFFNLRHFCGDGLPYDYEHLIVPRTLLALYQNCFVVKKLACLPFF